MPHLTRHQKQSLERQLRDRAQDLNVDVERERDKSDENLRVASEARDPGDFASAMITTDLNQAEIVRDVRELNAISSALRRIGGEEYGVCIDCGTEIPFARLKAQPAAVRCSRCQGAFERNFAGNGRGPTM
jgi:DnaK suppressor protein